MGQRQGTHHKWAKDKEHIKNILRVQSENLQITYLRIPLSHSKLKSRDFGILLDKINKKFNHWKKRMLNIPS